MAVGLRIAVSALGLSFCLGCSLLAPSKDEISRGEPNPGGSGGVSTGGAAGSSGSGGGIAGSGTGGTGGSAGGSAGGGLLFADEFDSEKPEWQFGGETGWSLAGGEALQSDASATYAVRWLPSLANLTDYRIEVKARRTAPSFGAIQVLFRQTADSSFYYCSFHPSVGEMFWGMYSANWTTTELGTAPQFAVDYDPNQTFTLTVIANGPQFTCRVEEIPEAVASLYDTNYTEGSPGLKTYQLATAYDYIRVYSP